MSPEEIIEEVFEEEPIVVGTVIVPTRFIVEKKIANFMQRHPRASDERRSERCRRNNCSLKPGLKYEAVLCPIARSYHPKYSRMFLKNNQLILGGMKGLLLVFEQLLYKLPNPSFRRCIVSLDAKRNLPKRNRSSAGADWGVPEMFYHNFSVGIFRLSYDIAYNAHRGSDTYLLGFRLKTSEKEKGTVF